MNKDLTNTIYLITRKEACEMVGIKCNEGNEAQAFNLWIKRHFPHTQCVARWKGKHLLPKDSVCKALNRIYSDDF